jgi:hypothetical protein
MKTFTYQGPVSKLTFRDNGTLKGVMLFPGALVTVPEDDERVSMLVNRGHLTEVLVADGGASTVATGEPELGGDLQLAAEETRAAQEESSGEARAARRGRKSEEHS